MITPQWKDSRETVRYADAIIGSNHVMFWLYRWVRIAGVIKSFYERATFFSSRLEWSITAVRRKKWLTCWVLTHSFNKQCVYIAKVLIDQQDRELVWLNGGRQRWKALIFLWYPSSEKHFSSLLYGAILLLPSYTVLALSSFSMKYCLVSRGDLDRKTYKDLRTNAVVDGGRH